MTKNNPSQATSQGRGTRRQPPNTRRPLSSFILHTSYFLSVLTFAFAFSFLPTVLDAQGCAMCYNSASAAHAGAKEALANGVLILLIPPMVFFALITVVVYIYRNKFREMSVVSGPLSADPVTERWSEPSAGAPEFGFCSPDHPIIRSPDPLPRATDN